MTTTDQGETSDWSDAVFAAMKARNIGTVATVPDGGLVRLLNLCQDVRTCGWSR